MMCSPQVSGWHLGPETGLVFRTKAAWVGSSLLICFMCPSALQHVLGFCAFKKEKTMHVITMLARPNLRCKHK